MSKLKMIQSAVTFTAGLGVGQILSGVVFSTTPTDTTYQKVTVYTARLALGMVIGEAIDNYADRQVDALTNWWKENITTKLEPAPKK